MPINKRSSERPGKSAVFRSQQRPGDKRPGGERDKTENVLAEAASHIEAGKYGRASASLKQVLSSEPNHPTALRLSATLHLKLGSLVAARAAFEKLACQDLERQAFQSAESLLREYLAVGPRCVPFLELLGRTLELSGDPLNAAAEYGKAIDILAEENGQDLENKGAELYEKIKHLDPSGEVARRAARAFERPQADTAGPASDTAPAQSKGTTSAPAAGAVAQAEAHKPTAPSTRPWEDQSAPALFPWEIEESSGILPSQPSTPSATETAHASNPSSTVEAKIPEPVASEESELARASTEKASAAIEESPISSSSDAVAVEQEEPELELKQEPAPEVPSVDLRVASEPTVETPAEAVPSISLSEATPQDIEFAGESDAQPSVTVEPSTEPAVGGTNSAPSWGHTLDELPPTREPEAGAVSIADAAAEVPRLAEQHTDLAPRAEAGAETAERPLFLDETSGEAAAALVVDRETAGNAPAASADAPSSVSEDLPSEPGLGEEPRDHAGAEGLTFVEGPPAWVTSEEAFTATPQLAEPDVVTTEEPSEPRRRRRARSKGPTWAAPSASEGVAEPKKKFSITDFFPTAGKLRLQVMVGTQRVTSTVRSVGVVALAFTTTCAVIGLLAVVAVSLVWIAMEEEPSSAFHSLTAVPPQSVLSARSNGYTVLRGMGVVSSTEPFRMGERRAIVPPPGASEATWPQGFPDVSSAVTGWYATWDPAAAFQRQSAQLRQWVRVHGSAVGQYRRSIGLSFDDLGYGSPDAPDEAYILAVHRLYVAEGFSRGVRAAVDRLEGDMESWRKALEKSKSLRLKMLAVEAMSDDLMIVSGLLGRPQLDEPLIPRLARMSRPMSHAEGSLRWPLQSQFVLEAQQVKRVLRGDGLAQAGFSLKALSYMPLPEQRTLNAHAAYYEALAKYGSLLEENVGVRTSMPRRYDFTLMPAQTFGDYIRNPIDNALLADDSRVNWETITGRVLELEARLRLATLQARLRRAAFVRDPIQRIAKAGQRFYDPFTAFTMLANPSKTVLYSVGKDGIDNDGDLFKDVSVPLYVPAR